MSTPSHILVIDPGVRSPELESFNLIAQQSPLPVTYHLPALFGFDSLFLEEKGIAGMILLGSLSSVHDRLPWQPILEEWVKKKTEAGVPTFGICYGHQMLAYMYGGEVGYLFPDRKKLLGFRTVNLKANPLWGGTAIDGPLYVSHNECVRTVPPGFKVTATSSEVAIDGLAHATLPIWSFQPHPEATTSFRERREKPGSGGPNHFSFGHQLLKHFIDYVGRRPAK